jgi:hypothetical protein
MAEATTLPPSVNDVLGECDRLVAQGLLEAAIEILEEYLTENGEHPLVLRSIARIYMLQRKPQNAVELLKRALMLMEDAKRPIHTQIFKPPLSITIPPIDSDRLSEVDLEIIEDTVSEIHANRNYYEGDEDLVCTENTSTVDPIESAQKASSIPIAYAYNAGANQIHSVSESLFPESKTADFEPSTIDNEAYQRGAGKTDDDYDNGATGFEIEHDFYSAEDLPSLDDLEIEEDISENGWVEDFILENTNPPGEFSYEYAWEEFEPVGVDFSEGISASDFLEVRSESKLSRFKRARQIALQLGSEYGWDESGIRLLTKIFRTYAKYIYTSI